MAGLAEAIVMGNKLYKAGKQVKNSVQSVNRGLKTYDKKQQKIAKPKPKPVARPAQAKPMKTAPVKKPNIKKK